MKTNGLYLNSKTNEFQQVQYRMKDLVTKWCKPYDFKLYEGRKQSTKLYCVSIQKTGGKALMNTKALKWLPLNSKWWLEVWACFWERIHKELFW